MHPRDEASASMIAETLTEFLKEDAMDALLLLKTVQQILEITEGEQDRLVELYLQLLSRIRGQPCLQQTGQLLRLLDVIDWTVPCPEVYTPCLMTGLQRLFLGICWNHPWVYS